MAEARIAGLAGLVVAIGAAAGHAQDRDTGGVTTRLSVEQRFEVSDNVALELDPDGTTTQALTRLSFGVNSETAVSTLSFDAAGALRIIEGPDTDEVETRFADPSIGFSYSRAGARAGFDASLAYSETEIAFLRPLEDFIDADGGLDLPSDIEDLEGTGERQRLSYDLRLALREDAPFGITLRAGQTFLSYSDVTASDLQDSTSSDLGIGLRLDLTPITRATLDLGYAVFDEDGAAARETWSLDAALVGERPDGAVRLGFGYEDTEDGDRLRAEIGRDYVLPAGALSGSIGAVSDSGGDVGLIASLDWRHQRPRDLFEAGLSRSVTSGADDEERRSTTLTLGWARELSPLATFGLDAAYLRSEATEGDDALDTGSLTASLGYALTPDWSLRTGYRYEFRDETGEGVAEENQLFLTLRRDFVSRR